MAATESASFKMKSNSLFYVFILFSLFLVCSNKASEIARPRGVSISKASLYIPGKDFTCFDNSNVIPFSQVNDDYCDCSDGSDEPGTSACPNSFFHCTNAGYRPSNIPSSQVNDGLCDCCDGADEYTGKTFCENTCQELGKFERQENQKRAEIAKAGNEARKEASKRGKQLKDEKRERLEQLERERQEAEKLKEEKEALKTEAEELEKVALDRYKKIADDASEARREEEKKSDEREAESIFHLLDSNGDKYIDISELQARQTFDQNKDGVVSDEEAKFFLDNNEQLDFDSFLETAWPRMKPFFMLDKGLFKPPIPTISTDELDVGVGSVEDVTGEYHQERSQDKEIEETVDDEAQLEPEEVDEHGDDEEEEEIDEEAEEVPEENAQNDAQVPQYDEETLNLVNAAQSARSELEEADRNIRDIQREINQLQEYMEKDFGPDEEFASLEGECFEYTDREYTYKLCPFDQASQRPKNGGAETRLGVWKEWAGPANNKYSAMAYDKGQSCWNGPQRSTFVAVSCGLENALVAVSEPNKCEYRFQFNSPSACRVSDGQADSYHDEL